MKKFLTIVLAVALMLTCVSLVACKKDDNDEASIAGIYVLTSATENGEDMPIPEGFSSSIELKEDGSFTMSQSMGDHSESYSGTWAKDGDTVTLTPTPVPDENLEPVTLTAGENTLSLSETYGEDTQVMVFTKQ